MVEISMILQGDQSSLQLLVQHAHRLPLTSIIRWNLHSEASAEILTEYVQFNLLESVEQKEKMCVAIKISQKQMDLGRYGDWKSQKTQELLLFSWTSVKKRGKSKQLTNISVNKVIPFDTR